LLQLTKDHSLFSELMECGKSARFADAIQAKNIITRAIGTEPFVEPTVEVDSIEVGDLYLLCSDGLTDLVTFEEIEALLAGSLTVEEKVRSLVSVAKRKGGDDNVTCVCVEVQEANEEARGNEEEDLSRQ
jgi:protein phosphatase